MNLSIGDLKDPTHHSAQLSHFKDNETEAHGKLGVLCKATFIRITYLLKFVLLLENVLIFPFNVSC